MGDPKVFVDAKIAGKRIVMFSKTTCPYCTMAKKTLKPYIGNLVPEDEYEVIELDGNSQAQDILAYLQKITGGRTVPRVFIGQKFVGGGDDVVAKDKSGELKKLLTA